MTLCRKNRKVREAGAEKARGSVVQEEPRELGRERAGWVLLSLLQECCLTLVVLKQENGIF